MVHAADVLVSTHLVNRYSAFSDAYRCRESIQPILERVLHFLADRKRFRRGHEITVGTRHLEAASLVCRTWRKPAQDELVKSIEIKDGELVEPFHERLCCEASPIPPIRRLRIIIYGDDDWTSLSWQEVTALLLPLKGLRDLFLLLNVTCLDSSFGEALSSLENLQVLRIWHEQDDDEREETYVDLHQNLCVTISMMPRLQMLSFTRCRLPKSTAGGNRRAPIQHLFLVDCLFTSGSLTWLLDRNETPLQRVALRSICVEVSDEFEPFFKVHGPDLTHLALEVGNYYDSNYSSPILAALPHCTHLRHLSLGDYQFAIKDLTLPISLQTLRILTTDAATLLQHIATLHVPALKHATIAHQVMWRDEQLKQAEDAAKAVASKLLIGTRVEVVYKETLELVETLQAHSIGLVND